MDPDRGVEMEQTAMVNLKLVGTLSFTLVELEKTKSQPPHCKH